MEVEPKEMTVAEMIQNRLGRQERVMEEMKWKRLEREVLTWMALMDSYLRDSGRYHFHLETSLDGEERDYLNNSLLPFI